MTSYVFIGLTVDLGGELDLTSSFTKSTYRVSELLEAPSQANYWDLMI